VADYRLWRLKKLHQAVDAQLHCPAADAFEIRYLLNGQLSYTRQCGSRADALADAATKRAELERDGWVFHW
jgi:hypothetical protein